MSKLTEAQRDFLERVRDGRRLALADRAQDKVRQQCRRAGWAEVLMNPRRWSVTAAGTQAPQDREGT